MTIPKTRKTGSKAVAKAPAKTVADATKAADARAVARLLQRQNDGEQRLMLNLRRTGPNASSRAPIEGMSDHMLTLRLMDAFGSMSPEFVDAQISNLLTVFDAPTERRETREMNAALAVLDGLKPENEIEAMLVTQMVAANDAAMKCLAQIKNQMGAEIYGGLAIKLMRTFTGQAEALAKLRRRGEQTVKVVHVYPGGQAVVGDVHNHAQPAEGRGPQTKIEGQWNATGNTGTGTTLLGENENGEAVPSPRRRRKAPLPNARRN